jgi:hypothetical protein
MKLLRDSSVRRLSAALAGLALYLQLAFAGPGMLALAASSDSIDQLAAHALCLGGGSSTDPQPADGGPTLPGHDHSLFCCLWHPLPGVAPQAALPPALVAYATIALRDLGRLALVNGPSHGPANARAPPA